MSRGNGAGGGGSIRYTSYSHRAVYDPNNPGANCEYESFSRGIRGQGSERSLISETHRTYSDSSGYERVGLARTLADKGHSITRERFSNGEERSSQTFRSISASQAADFDGQWQSQALSSRLDRIDFLKGSTLRQQIQHQQSRAAASREERDIARRGRAMFDRHTEQVMREARGYREGHGTGAGAGSRPEGRARVIGGRSLGAPPQHNSSRGSEEDPTALRFARQEAERFWG
mmetsp:Transcript_30621/g.65581  ORF Transcript_30621/g.65581 Transcript_30621/m.65581 type:complete len:232 (+) Transcript_30621:171-866(+)